MSDFRPGESIHADSMANLKIAGWILLPVFSLVYWSLFASNAPTWEKLLFGFPVVIPFLCLGCAWRWSRLSPEAQRVEAAHEDFVMTNGGLGNRDIYIPRDEEGHPLDVFGRRSCGCVGHAKR